MKCAWSGERNPSHDMWTWEEKYCLPLKSLRNQVSNTSQEEGGVIQMSNDWLLGKVNLWQSKICSLNEKTIDLSFWLCIQLIIIIMKIIIKDCRMRLNLQVCIKWIRGQVWSRRENADDKNNACIVMYISNNNEWMNENLTSID